MAEGGFREDLYYRINVIEMRVPALRERPDDIPELAETHPAAAGPADGNRAARARPRSACRRSSAIAFPGNVRELENILERALTLCAGGAIDAKDLQLRPTRRSALRRPRQRRSAPATARRAARGRRARRHPEALEQTRYNKTAAAKLLGMSFRALRYRIKKLGIE